MKKILFTLIVTASLLSAESKVYLTAIIFSGSGQGISTQQFETDSIEQCLEILKESKMVVSNGNDAEGGIAFTCGGKR